MRSSLLVIITPRTSSAVFTAYKEQSPAAKDALAQILTNSKLCAMGKRPSQDTGIATIFVKIGHGVNLISIINL